MVHSPQFLRRAGGLALAAALALSSAALAADTPALTAAERQEDLDLLCQALERYHPDLFANTPEADFLAKQAEIEGRLVGESGVEFALDLQSLAALAGDSHTQVSLNAVADQVRFYPAVLTWYDGHWYLTTAAAEHADLLGQAVSAVNGRSMEEVLEAFSALLSADNPVKLRRQYRQSCNVADLYEYLGLVPAGGALELSLENGRTLSVEPVDAAALDGVSLARLSDQITAKPVTAAAEDFYWGAPLDESTYYIQYNACQEDPELPMETFAAQTEAALDAGNYSRILVDLRNNGGGSDGVIWPLLAVLRQEMDEALSGGGFRRDGKSACTGIGASRSRFSRISGECGRTEAAGGKGVDVRQYHERRIFRRTPECLRAGRGCTDGSGRKTTGGDQEPDPAFGKHRGEKRRILKNGTGRSNAAGNRLR